MIKQLKRWLNGTATAADEQALDRASRTDDFGREALEGYRSMPEADHAKHIAALKSKLRQQEDNRRGGLVWWRIAAAAMMIGVVATWLFISNNSDNVGIAANDSKEQQQIATTSKEEAPALTQAAPITEEAPQDLEEEEVEAFVEVQSGSANPTQEGVTSESKKEPLPVQKPLSYEAGNIEAGFAEEEVAEVLADEPTLEPNAYSSDADQTTESATIAVTIDKDSNDLGKVEPQSAITGMESDRLDDKAAEVAPSSSVARDRNAKLKKRIFSAPNKDVASAQEALVTLQGFVYEEASEEPMIGASVYLKNTGDGALTDFDGAFQLRSSTPLPWTLVLSYTGFSSQEVTIHDVDEVVVLRMAEGDLLLDEVVITGNSSPKFLEIDPRPKGGWKKFDQYLLKNLQYPATAISEKVEGTVTVEFFINEKGKPEQFEIIESVCVPCDAEAIRLLEEGPKWRGKKKRATVAVKFNLE